MKLLGKQKELMLLPIRLVVGFGFLAHGYSKLERGPEKFAGILQALGIPAPHLTAWITSLLEVVGGLGLMVGVAVVPLTAPLAAIMLTALFSVHLRYGFSSIRLVAVAPEGAKFGPIGYELNLLYLAALLSLAIGGAGAASLDGYLKRMRRARSEHQVPSVPDFHRQHDELDPRLQERTCTPTHGQHPPQAFGRKQSRRDDDKHDHHLGHCWKHSPGPFRGKACAVDLAAPEEA